VGDFDLDVAIIGEYRMQPGLLAVSEPLCAGSQQVPDLVKRIVIAAAVAVRVLLDAAADLTDHLGAELDTVASANWSSTAFLYGIRT
jgi:hypothetical protein